MNFVKNCYHSCKGYLSPLGELYDKAQKESELSSSQNQIAQLEEEKQQLQQQLKKVQADLKFKTVECAKLQKLYDTKKSVESASAKVSSRNDVMRTIIADHKDLEQENASLKQSIIRIRQKRATIALAFTSLKDAFDRREQERLALGRVNAVVSVPTLASNTVQDSQTTPRNVLAVIEDIPPRGNVFAAIENTPANKLAVSNPNSLPGSAVASTLISQPSVPVRQSRNVENSQQQQHNYDHRMEAATAKRYREEDEGEDEHGNSTKKLKSIAH